MKIVESKSSKLKEIEKILLSSDYKNKKILIVDTVLGHYDSFNVGFIRYGNNMEMWEDFIDDEKYQEFIDNANRYDVVIFATNDKVETYDSYGAIEDKLNKEVIVTIQNDSIQDINIFEV